MFRGAGRSDDWGWSSEGKMGKDSDNGSVRLEPIPRTTLTQALFAKLVGHVVGGDWKEGERIPAERELSEQLGIGRTSLREALKALELLGMLDSRVGDGTFVLPRSEFLSRPLLWAIAGTDRSELRELIEARLVLEEKLAALAAERGTPEELRRIGAAVEEMRARLDDPPAVLEADMRFHVAIAEAAHNQVLLNAVQLLRNVMKPYLLLKHRIPAAALRSLEQHERVHAAILLRDPARAREEMSNHLLTSGGFVLEIVDRQ
jgi:GntR family transcriptional repressor for pyruvate dehydrogenase complex